MNLFQIIVCLVLIIPHNGVGQSVEPDTTAYEAMIVKVDSLYNIGALYQCLEACDEFIQLCSHEYGIESIEAWDARSYKGLILMNSSKFAEAEMVMNDLLVAVNPDESDDHQFVYASTLANYALLLQRTGKVVEALTAHREVLHLDSIMGYENDPEHAQVLNNLAVSYESFGDSRSALHFLAKALPLTSERSRSFCFQNIAESYKQLGDFRKSMTYFEKADSLFVQLYGLDHLETLNCRINYASLRLDLGEYGAVIDILVDLEKRAQKNTEIQSSHDLHARIQRHLFLAYISTREFEKAEKYLEKYQQTLSVLYNDQPHLQQIAQLQEVSLLEEQGEFQKADELISTWYKNVDEIELFDVGVEISEKYVSIKEAVGQVNEAMKVQQILLYDLQKSGRYGLKLLVGKSNLSRMFFNSGDYLKSKALNLETMESIIHQVNTIYPYLSDNGKLKFKSHTRPVLDFLHLSLVDTFYLDKEYLKRFHELHQNYTSLAMDYSQVSQTDRALNVKEYDAWSQARHKIEEAYLNSSANSESLDSLLSLANEMERQLSAGIQFQYKPLNYDEYQEQLEEDETVVQFVAWTAEDVELRYFALIDSRDEDPVLVDCSIDEITTSSMMAIDIYDQLWQDISPYIPAGNIIYIVPDGDLHKVSFYSIRHPQTGNYLFKKYSIHILPNLRMLHSFNTMKNYNQTIALFGNPVYSGGLTDSKNLMSGPATELPATRKEILSVQNIFEASGWEVDVFEKEKANKMELQKMSGSDISLLHIASHGIYRPVSVKKTIGMNTINEKFPAVNPMFQSALYLSDDVPDSVSNPTTGNGYLSAFEISNMLFQNLKLVTLSSCESGLGTAYASEGVFGLRRGFLLAGAENIISTLTKIPDAATSEFMTHFYQNLVSGVTIFDSFKSTQEYMADRYPPEVWGSFVLIGRGDFKITNHRSNWWFPLVLFLLLMCVLVYWVRSRFKSSARLTLK